MGDVGGSPPAVRIDVAGLRLRIEAERPGDLELIRRLVGSAGGDGPPAAVIRIGGRSPTMPSRPPDFEGPYGDHWSDGRTHHFLHHWGFGAAISPGQVVMGGPASGFERWVTVRNSMLFVLAHLFLDVGRFVLHGAAVRRSRGALLVVGDSGTGKSTLAFAAGRAGWHVLADDMVVITPAGGDLSVQGIPRTPSVPGDVAAPAGVEGERLPDDDRARVELVGFELDTRPAPVDSVVVCGHSDADGAVESIDAAVAAQHLVPAFVLSALEDAVQRWFPVAIELSRRPGVELHHASRPERRVERAAELLDGVDALVRPGALRAPQVP